MKRRQGMTVTPNELMRLANALALECGNEMRELSIPITYDELMNKTFQVNIVNDDESSDGWRFES